MSRLPPVTEDKNPEAAAVYAQIKQPAAMFRTFCAASAMRLKGCAHLPRMASTCAYRTGLNGRLRELVILALARGNQYAWTHHAPFALKEGATQAELDALNAGTLPAS
jgi:hypothetical protein